MHYVRQQRCYCQLLYTARVTYMVCILPDLKKKTKQTENKTTKRADTGEGVPNKLASVYP